MASSVGLQDIVRHIETLLLFLLLLFLDFGHNLSLKYILCLQIAFIGPLKLASIHAIDLRHLPGHLSLKLFILVLHDGLYLLVVVQQDLVNLLLVESHR